MDPFGFVLPPNPHEVHGDPSQHDDHSQAADHWFRVQTEPQQHSPKYQVADGDQQVYLHGTDEMIVLINVLTFSCRTHKPADWKDWEDWEVLQRPLGTIHTPTCTALLFVCIFYLTCAFIVVSVVHSVLVGQ